jgi:DNA-binding protein YbaB
MFDKIKDLYGYQKKAKVIKKELQNTHIEAEVDGVIVIINGEQEVIDIKIPDEMLANGQKLSETLTKCMNKAIKKAQQIAAELMKDMMGGGLPGLT